MTSTSSSLRRKNLVILRAGDSSLHPEWVKGDVRDFDLFISYYGSTPDLHKDTADFYEMRKGPKWSCIADLMQVHPELVDRYDAFWFPDDDLASTTDNINQMFAFFHAFKLALAQPALTRDSYYSWNNLLQRDDYLIRYVQFVEVMAPIFDRASLKVCLQSFGESRSGWGLDWLWPELIGQARDDRIAIIDATPVKHTRPIGGNLYTNNPELDPRRDEQMIIEKYNLHQSRITGKYVLFGGVCRRAPTLGDRIQLTIRSLNSRRLARRRSRK